MPAQKVFIHRANQEFKLKSYLSAVALVIVHSVWAAKAVEPQAEFDLAKSAPSDHAIAHQVISQAIENIYRGKYQADVEMVRSSYLEGMERLLGKIEVDDQNGDKSLVLKGDSDGFQYRSSGFGREQWVTDERTQRIRRIANRQWKKSAFGTVLSYEDILKLPGDLLRETATCRSFRQTDSSYEMELTLKPLYQTFYSRVDAVLSRSPILLKRLALYDQHGKRVKEIDATGYKEISGKWLLTSFQVANCDSSASAIIALRQPQFPNDVGSQRDHTLASTPPPKPELRLPVPTMSATAKPGEPHPEQDALQNPVDD